MKVKTLELTGAALDWAVAKCERLPIKRDPMGFGPSFSEGGYWIWDDSGPIGKRDYRLIGRQYSPTTNWSQAGPIIERERIELRLDRSGRWKDAWQASILERMLGGTTPLIAAMRCYVASKLGDEVEIPKELV